MTIREVIDRVLAYHPQFPADYEGCDDFKCGYPEDECTGIVSALVPTVDVIRKTIDAGANLLLVHEPTFYSTMDYPDWRAGFDRYMRKNGNCWINTESPYGATTTTCMRISRIGSLPV